jgi:hypothetical protein
MDLFLSSDEEGWETPVLLGPSLHIKIKKTDPVLKTLRFLVIQNSA